MGLMMADRAIRRLLAQRLTPDRFAPFGVLPTDEGGPGPTADLEFTRADGWVNFISHAASEVEHGPTGPRCDHLNRHDTHTQTLVPMDGDALLVVAPPAAAFAATADLDLVAAFLIPQHQPVHLHRGTWHWGPYPVGRASVRLLNIQGRGWPTDNTVATLPTALEISPPA
jgi:ureidoglycolate hydrolase